ncbi:MAG: radical SAM protein, partial [Clostridia bacterium]|nr:radical SAM protein [Clostridia bacterium]
CYLIDVGVESGNEEIRMKYCKRMMTNEQMINAFSWFHKYDFTTMTYNIVGLPYETLAKTLETIKLNVQLNPDKVIPNIFYPYPHTVLADIASKCGTFPDVIPADMKVPFYQKDYPPHEVLYASNFFHKYIKRYKRCAKYRPRWLGKLFEKMYDRRFTSKLVPRKFLNWQYDLRHRAILRTKRFVIRKMPKLYLFLRRKRNRIKDNNEAKETKES